MKYVLSILIIFCFSVWGIYSLTTKPASTIDPIKIAVSSSPLVTPETINPPTTSWLEQTTHLILSKANNINPEALKISLTAYQKAREQGLDDKEILTIIDYSKPSSQRRLWVIDLKTGNVLFNTWVAHGKNSGAGMATSFSNNPQSLKSSIGVYLTNEVYDGHHGSSLRIQGLEPGFNNNALKRNVVFHGATYVGEDIARNRGMLGRSWGCMAV
ncbi:MAG: murein L,D-transpeptidase catalytic domain family protein, partial [Gammaproteobacteria bacterium]|nr:murein L,D-transpeptidase catalytic domain family protein [Gammaproteobacteria bacterium]